MEKQTKTAKAPGAEAPQMRPLTHDELHQQLHRDLKDLHALVAWLATDPEILKEIVKVAHARRLQAIELKTQGDGGQQQ